MAYVEKTNFTDLQTLIASAVTYLSENGFTVINTIEEVSRYEVILEADDAVDPFKSYTGAYPWRIAFVVLGKSMHMYVSTERYLKNNGEIVAENYLYPNEPTPKNVVVNPGLIHLFCVRDLISGNLGEVYPMSYVISTSDHGFFFGITDDANDEYQNSRRVENSMVVSPRFSWIMVQRPLKVSGDVYVEGKAPLVCVYTKMETLPDTFDSNGNKLKTSANYMPIQQVPYFFIVSESDVSRPSRHCRADISTDQSKPILNVHQQVSFTEDDKVLLTVPNGFNTSRYYYPLDLDMIATCSSDVIAKGEKIKVVKYNNVESEYLALSASKLFSTGMRLLVAIDSPSSLNNLPPRT